MSIFNIGSPYKPELFLLLFLCFADWSSQGCTVENLESSGSKIMMSGPIVQTKKAYKILEDEYRGFHNLTCFFFVCFVFALLVLTLQDSRHPWSIFGAVGNI